MNKLSKDREWYINLAICLCAFLSLEIFPFIVSSTLKNVIKNKWVRAIISGILFGGAHLLTGNVIRLVDLLFLLPYGSLGFVFSLMDSDTKTTFTSIAYHGIHNAVTGILLLLVSSLGVAI